MVKYYYDGATRMAMRTGSSLNWLFGDHLGSSSRAANSDGTPLTNGEQRYKPWGEKRFPTGDSALPTTYRFTGQRQEKLLGGAEGLYFYGARWYDPALGRFVSPDTVIPVQSQGVQAWDRYAYVNNNPIRYNDPTGHMVDDGCRSEGCRGNPNVIRHTILLGQYNSREPLEPKDSLPGNGSTEPIVRAVEPASDILPTQYPSENVATFLSYSIDGNGTVDDFEYSVWNDSDKSFFVAYARLVTQESPMAPLCIKNETYYDRPQGLDWLATVEPQTTANIPLDFGSPPISVSYNADVTVRIYFYSLLGLLPWTEKTTIGIPRL